MFGAWTVLAHYQPLPGQSKKEDKNQRQSRVIKLKLECTKSRPPKTQPIPTQAVSTSQPQTPSFLKTKHP